MAVVLRLPFLGTLGPDEGGYAYIASAWARGGHLYGKVWVDRPQGLMLAYRFLLGIAHQAWAIRLGAVDHILPANQMTAVLLEHVAATKETA